MENNTELSSASKMFENSGQITDYYCTTDWFEIIVDLRPIWKKK